MKFVRAILFYCFPFALSAQVNPTALPIYRADQYSASLQDWLLRPPTLKAGAFWGQAGHRNLILTNGLVERVFRLAPAVTCTSFKNLSTAEELVRAVKPEAILELNGKSYALGGLSGQKENAYLQDEWLDNMKPASGDFVFLGFAVDSLSALLKWKPTTWLSNPKQPSGITVTFNYGSKIPTLSGLLVQVHYSIYDGLPLLSKWVTIENKGDQPVKVDRVVNEILGVPEEESAVVGETSQMKKPHGIYIESDYAFNNAMRYDLSDQTLHWKADSAYSSQVNYEYKTPCMMEVYVEKGPGLTLRQGDHFRSVRTFELLIDSYDRERRGLSIRRMYRHIAPWTTQNPIFMHLVSHRDEEVMKAVDQCAATGYEALIMSFGSHCDMEDSSLANIQKWKTLADYAHQRHILIGGYSLFSSRQVSDEDDVIDPVTGKPDAGAFFGHAPCYGSRWGLAYLEKIKYFLSQTGFNLFENDGPYPGDLCASTFHPGHSGLADSQWKQMELQKSLFHWCNEHGIFVNAPDWYFLDGTNKIGLGYREVNFSLPREQQLILNRQNIFDGTWEKTGSMSWGFVPLTKYQGGGPEAVLEPLEDHLKEYKQFMIQYYGAGIQACYRGPRLFDTEKTRQTVHAVIAWYKHYRNVLNGDIIHLRRADGRDWDGWLQVDPAGKTKGMIFFFNPLPTKITRTIPVSLYYAGLVSKAIIRENGQAPKAFSLDRNYRVWLTTTLAPGGFTWYSIE